MERNTESIESLQPGDLFLEYQIDFLIGPGALAVVYGARGPSGEHVALKFLRRKLSADRVFRQRFLRGAEFQRGIDHPHVARVLASGERSGVVWLVQPYFSGGSLADKIATGPMDPAPVARMCGEVADALDSVHRHGVFLRNLKPPYVLFDDSDSAHINNFFFHKPRFGEPLTEPGQALGSADWMSPEQIRGEEITAASDVYHLGCAIYECIAGSPPFPDREGMRVLWAHLREEPSDPCADRSDVPSGFGAAILRALEKEPARRPQTTGEYAQIVLEASRGRA